MAAIRSAARSDARMFVTSQDLCCRFENGEIMQKVPPRLGSNGGPFVGRYHLEVTRATAKTALFGGFAMLVPWEW